MNYKLRSAQLSFFNTIFWFLAISYLIITKFPQWLQDHVRSNFTGVAYIALGYASVQLIFDLIGLRIYNRENNSDKKLNTLRLFKGILFHTFFLIAMMMLVLLISQKVGVWFAIVVVFAIMSITISFQEQIMNWLATVNEIRFNNEFIRDLLKPHYLKTPVIKIKNIGHPLFTGAVCGDSGKEKVIVSAQILENVSANNFKNYIIGKIAEIDGGSFGRSKRFGFISNVLGFVVAAYLSNFELNNISGLLSTILLFSIWQMFSFIILKSLTIKGIHESDVFCIDNHVPFEDLETTITALNKETAGQSPWFLFSNHVANEARLDFVKNYDENPWGAGYASSLMLFLSWPCMGLCSRTMNYNVGCPELWIIQPNN